MVLLDAIMDICLNTMEEIKNEYISNIIQEDIETYISLHQEITNDLLEHCAIMTDQLYKEYQLSL
jgi:hypothetical protein